MYTSKYPIPQITADAIIIKRNPKRILLIKRKKEPFKDLYALPGGFFNQYESARDACIREVMEETGIDISISCPKKPFDVISKEFRDPRGWVISVPFLIHLRENVELKAGDDATEAKWFELSAIDFLILAFDHREIILSIIK